MLSKKKINKSYISEIDQFLTEFDRTHSLSASQQAEITKYKRIYHLRDVPVMSEHKPEEII